MRGAKWISLNDAALVIVEARFSQEDRRRAVDRVRHALVYAVSRGHLLERARGSQRGFLLADFERWAAKHYPGPDRRIEARAAGAAFRSHAAAIVGAPAGDTAEAQQAALARQWQQVAEQLRAQLDQCKAENAEWRRKDRQRRAAASQQGKKGGRPRV